MEMQELSNVIASKYEEIIKKVKDFSSEYLNEDYEKICVLAVDTLFKNHEEELKKGKSLSWAAGIVHAIGTLNSLFDSKEEPYIKVADLYKALGVSSSTGSSKSKEVKSLLDLSEENKQWIISKNAVTVKDKPKVKKENLTKAKKSENIKGKIEEDKKEPFKFAVHKNYIDAQRIIDLAWKQKNYKNKAKYAVEALKIYEDCADAYIILSRDLSLTDVQKKELLEKAVKAAQNLLKIDSLEQAQPEIFKLKVAQPLFGAMYNLAVHLWKIGEKDKAIEQAFEILKYNEQDNLMIRTLLVNWLLLEKRYSQLKDLLDKYEKDSLAAIHYSKVALLYKTNEIKAAESALRRAYRKNPYVIPYILRQKRVPNTLPHTVKFGSEEEAIRYAHLGVEVWDDSNMLKWIKEKKNDFDIIGFN